MWTGFWQTEETKDENLVAKLNCFQRREGKKQTKLKNWKKKNPAQQNTQLKEASCQQKADFFHPGGLGSLWVQLLAVCPAA